MWVVVLRAFRVFFNGKQLFEEDFVLVVNFPLSFYRLSRSFVSISKLAYLFLGNSRTSVSPSASSKLSACGAGSCYSHDERSLSRHFRLDMQRAFKQLF